MLLKLRHSDLLPAIGVANTIPVLPCSSKCPICGLEGALEISRGVAGDVYRCTNDSCLFMGDGISLFQYCTGLSDDREAVGALLRKGVLHGYPEISEDVTSFCAQRRKRVRDIMLWRQFNDRFQQADTLAGAFLQHHGLNVPGVYGLDGLGRYLGVASGRRLRDSLGLAPEYRKSVIWNSTYLVTPMWLDPMTINGYLAFRGDEHMVLPFGGKTLSTCGMAFLHGCRMSDKTMVVCDSPWSVLESVVWQTVNCQRFSIIYAPAATQALNNYLMPDRLFVNLSSEPAYYQMALRSTPSRIVTRQTLDNADEEQLVNSRNFFDAWKCLAKPVHAAIADHLADLELEAADFFISQLELSTTDINKVIAASQSSDRHRLQDLLRNRMLNRMVNVRGKKVGAGIDGWYVTPARGAPEQISNTVFYLDSVFIDSRQQTYTATGTISQNGRDLTFQSPWEDVRTRTYEWLKEILAKHGMGLPLIKREWEKRLYDVSTSFQEPNTRYSSTCTSWSEDLTTLIMPEIVVTAGEVRENNDLKFADTVAAGLSMPRPLTDNERANAGYGDQTGAVFWALFSCVASNILSPYHGQGTRGIALVEDPQAELHRMVRHMIGEIGLHTVSFHAMSKARLNDMILLEQQCPFPLFIGEQWNDSPGFRQWLAASTARNCLAQMSPAVAACTALDGGWVYLVPRGLNDSWMRFDGLWRLLPEFIAFVQRSATKWPEGVMQLNDHINHLLLSWLTDLGIEAKAVIDRIPSVCNPDITRKNTAFAVRFINFLVDSLSCGMIDFRRSNEEHDITSDIVSVSAKKIVFVSAEAVDNLFQRMGVKPLPRTRIREELQDINVLTTNKFEGMIGYGIDLEYWSMNHSMRPTMGT